MTVLLIIYAKELKTQLYFTSYCSGSFITFDLFHGAFLVLLFLFHSFALCAFLIVLFNGKIKTDGLAF